MAVVCCQNSLTKLPKRLHSSFLGRTPSLLGKSPFGKTFLHPVRLSKINAIFWGPKKTVEPREMDLSLGEFNLTRSGLQGGETGSEMKPQKIFLLVVSSILEVSSDDWDACAMGAAGPEKLNPFLTHGFLSSLEESGCAVKETGWLPRHIIAQDEFKNVVGVVPLYLKSHSYGEFVFDYSWADAYYSFGSTYYPKLQCCVPFTPVTGQRILIRNTWFKDQIFEKLVSALKDLTAKFEVSSLHITFPSENEWHKMKEHGFLQRIGMQYHWKNRNYRSFDDFLMDMKQSKRKNIRQERKKISAQSLKMKRLRGGEIKARHWDSFYKFYRNTTDNKFVRFLYRILMSLLIPFFLFIVPDAAPLWMIIITQLFVVALDTYSPVSRSRWWYLVVGMCIIKVSSVGIGQCIGKLVLSDMSEMYRRDSRWGRAFLTRDFFHNMGAKLGDNVLLIVAEEEDKLVAGALNLIGGDTLFGRLWGCLPEAYYPSLHFEACYYQAIEAAIEMNLEKVEAGAQGEHKIQRGYLPVTTYSCHYILDEGFRKAIQDFLVRETDQVKLVMKLLHDSSPFKDGVEH